MTPKNFALIGAAGFVAPRHMKAIRDTGNKLVAAVDPHDSVGAMDSFSPEARFFTEIERFDRHLEKLRRKSDEERVHYVSICSPNYLHDAHIRLALRLHACAICEKPLVINPWNLDALQELEEESEGSVYTVFQLRYLPGLLELKKQLESSAQTQPADVVLTYVTRRGAWYPVSWKGSSEKAGGVAMNIGIHFFDLVAWLFGPVEASEVHLSRPDKMAGCLQLGGARVRWFLSVDGSDIPEPMRADGKHAFRSMTVDGNEIEFSTGFENLHTKVYEETLAGGGLGIRDARPSIQMVYDIRNAEVKAAGGNAHPLLKG